MKRKPMPIGLAMFLLTVGLLLGSVFTFGMQYWNAKAAYDDCKKIETQFLSYRESHRIGLKPTHRKGQNELIIDCANGERYFIDGECNNAQLRSALSKLTPNENISLRLHPNQNKIVEFSTETAKILHFDDTMQKLGSEATGFFYLGIFMYLCALLGLYYVIWHAIKRRKGKK